MIVRSRLAADLKATPFGDVRFSWGPGTAPFWDCLVGISPGGGHPSFAPNWFGYDLNTLAAAGFTGAPMEPLYTMWVLSGPIHGQGFNYSTPMCFLAHDLGTPMARYTVTY